MATDLTCKQLGYFFGYAKDPPTASAGAPRQPPAQRRNVTRACDVMLTAIRVVRQPSINSKAAVGNVAPSLKDGRISLPKRSLSREAAPREGG